MVLKRKVSFIALFLMVLLVAGCVQPSGMGSFKEGNPGSDISESKLEGRIPLLGVENDSSSGNVSDVLASAGAAGLMGQRNGL